MQKISIAIVGAGLAGLATAWHLLSTAPQSTEVYLTIFDEKGVGGGASGIAAGLLHPYTGAHAKKTPQAELLMAETLRLIQIATQHIKDPIILQKGILRPACTSEQIEDFNRCSQNNPDVQWTDPAACQLIFPAIKPGLSGILLTEGFAIDTPIYLQGLWIACQNMGARLLPVKIQNLADLAHFDHVIIAAGASSGLFPETSHLRLKQVKGQVIRCIWPEEISPPCFSLNSAGYLVMSADKHSCLIGSTYERNYFHEGPTPDSALPEVFAKIHPFFPELKTEDAIECMSGLRSTTPNHQPIASRINERTWIIAGLGSKGLLYHATLAKTLAQLLFS